MNRLGGDIDGYTDGEEPLVYHYGPSGERLRNAEDSVRKFYAGEGPQPPKGILRSLVQTRSSRLILLVMLAMMAITIITSIMDRGAGAAMVGVIPMELSAFSFDETVYISLHLKENSFDDLSDQLHLSCIFLFYTTDDQVVHKAVAETFYTGGEDFLRTTFGDYDILYVEAVVAAGGETQTLRADITRN